MKKWHWLSLLLLAQSRSPLRCPIALTCAIGLVMPIMAQAAIKNPDTFVFVMGSDIDGLDPVWAYDTASHLVIANVYEYLLAYKNEGKNELKPLLASQLPTVSNGLISKDGKTYTFPLRQGVKFHDGSLLTPEDVKYSLMRFMLLDRDGGPSGLLLEPVLGIPSTRDSKGHLLADVYEKANRAIENAPNKVIIHLDRPFAPFLSILASFGAVLSKPWCIRQGDWDGTAAAFAAHNNPARQNLPLMERMNGTGPFQLGRWEKRTKEIVLERFDGYWRKPARLKRVILKGIDEVATRKLMIQAGDADSIYSPQSFFPQVSNIPGVQIVDRLENLESPMYLMFTFRINATANPYIGSGKLDGNGIPPDFFTDKDIRKGFAYCIDSEAYIRDVLRGKGWNAGGIIPKGLLGHDPSPSPYRLDLVKAKEYFQKAWGGKVWKDGFELSVVFNTGSPIAQNLGGMIRKNVESINPKFKVNIKAIQWSTYLEQSQGGKIPIFIGNWMADYPDPHNFVYPFLAGAGYFPSKQGYSNAELDQLIAQAVSALDTAQRERLYRQIQKIALEDLPHVPIADGYRYRTQRSWVKGWKFNPTFPDSPYGDYYYDLYKEE